MRQCAFRAGIEDRSDVESADETARGGLRPRRVTTSPRVVGDEIERRRHINKKPLSMSGFLFLALGGNRKAVLNNH